MRNLGWNPVNNGIKRLSTGLRFFRTSLWTWEKNMALLMCFGAENGGGVLPWESSSEKRMMVCPPVPPRRVLSWSVLRPHEQEFWHPSQAFQCASCCWWDPLSSRTKATSMEPRLVRRERLSRESQGRTCGRGSVDGAHLGFAGPERRPEIAGAGGGLICCCRRRRCCS